MSYQQNPARSADVVTPGTDFKFTCVGIYIGGDGDVKVKFANGLERTFSSALAGTILPVRCIQVVASGTTATNMLALFN